MDMIENNLAHRVYSDVCNKSLNNLLTYVQLNFVNITETYNSENTSNLGT